MVNEHERDQVQHIAGNLSNHNLLKVGMLLVQK